MIKHVTQPPTRKGTCGYYIARLNPEKILAGDGCIQSFNAAEAILPRLDPHQRRVLNDHLAIRAVCVKMWAANMSAYTKEDLIDDYRKVIKARVKMRSPTKVDVIRFIYGPVWNDIPKQSSTAQSQEMSKAVLVATRPYTLREKAFDPAEPL